MSIKLQLNNENNDCKEKSIQYLPLQVNFDGKESEKTNVSECFDVYKEEKDGVLYNAFRGYPLKGCPMNVPTNYKGIIFDETNKPLSEDADRTLKEISTFTNFTYWNYDRVPSKNDALTKAYNWLDICNEVHSPVNPQELEEFLKNEEEKRHMKKET